MIKVVVTGSNGQLGNCIKSISKNYSSIAFSFMDSNSLDITNQTNINNVFLDAHYDYCINCAAYTAVDKAEEDNANATKVNVQGPKNLALACVKSKTILIHVSTDFVFNGESNIPYIETHETNPISVYGLTKRQGEIEIASILPEHYIFRTSWLYSEFNNNFVKTMLKLGADRDKLTIISDQIGTPTYAKDLAKAIVTVITSKKDNFGIYNYSNEGVASWYDFAKAIFEIKQTNIVVEPIPTSSYPTPAKRPFYSVLDKEKVKKTFSINIPYWRTSLKSCLSQL